MAPVLTALLLSSLAIFTVAQDANSVNNTASDRQLTNSVRVFSITNETGTLSPAPYGQIKVCTRCERSL
jgi:hypothetical protein